MIHTNGTCKAASKRAKVALAALATGMLLLSVGNVWAAHLLGTIPSSGDAATCPDVPVRIIRHRALPERTLPTSIYNITHLPVVRSQGLNNCGAFTPTYYYKTYQEAREHGWVRPDPATHPERIMSPGFTFPLVSGGLNEGANVRATMEVMVRHGVATWDVMPESPDYRTYPNEEAWRNAIPFRGAGLLSFDVSTQNGLLALKEHLASGDLAVMTLMLYHDTFDQYGKPGWGVGVDSDVIHANGTQPWAYHAFTLVGYDDNKSWMEGDVSHEGAFLAVNSWGPDWGILVAEAGTAGFAWFSYDYVMNKRGSLAGNIDAMEDRIGYQPIELAVVDMSIIARTYLSMGIYAGSPSNRLSDVLASFPNAGGSIPFSGRLVLDVTDFSALDPVCYTVSCYDVSSNFGVPSGSTTGYISGFHVEKPNDLIVSAPATATNPAMIKAGSVTTVSAGPFHPTRIGLDDLEQTAVSVSVADWNRDGDPDVALAGGALFGTEMLRLMWNTGADGGEGRLMDTEVQLADFNGAGMAWGDCDQDGLPDLAIMGRTGSNRVPGRVFLNLGVGGFTDSGIALPALDFASLAWGDYTNDGRLDLAFAGRGTDGNSAAQIWKNIGGGVLVESGIAFVSDSPVTVSWVDVNNDGWLDLAIGHRLYRNNGGESFDSPVILGTNSQQTNHAWGDMDGDGLVDVVLGGFENSSIQTRILQNRGNFIFEEVPKGIVGLYGSEFAWGDFDNDGRLDLLVSGYPVNDWSLTSTRIYRQLADSSLKDIGADIVGVSLGSVAWADFTRNGFLDLLVTGHHDQDPDSGRFRGRTAVYANKLDFGTGEARANLAPAIPDGLRVESAGGGAILLRWNDSVDSETPERAMRYRVRVGSFPGGWDVVSPTAEHDHAMRIGQTPGRLLNGMPSGRYYWKVQAVDGGMALSEWSDVYTFAIGAGDLISDDPNGDGTIDSADICHGGIVDSFAGGEIAKRLLGVIVTPDTVPIANATIGPDGGHLSAQPIGFEMYVPPGSFSQPTEIRLGVAASQGTLGPSMVPYTWRVDGLPIDHIQPLTVRVMDRRTDPDGAPYVAIGMEGFAPSINDLTTVYTAVEAVPVAGGWLEVTIPAPGPLSTKERSAIRGLSGKDVSSYEYWFVIHIFAASQWSFRGGNFNVTGPLDTKAQLSLIAADLEEQLQFYRNTLGFDTSRRDWTGYPVEVTLMPLGMGDNGEPVGGYMVSSMSYNGLAIQLNTKGIEKRSFTRASAAHELFHLMQGLYDSRNRVARATTSPNLWLDEATASYIEGHYSANPNSPTDLLNAYQQMIFGGFWQADSWSSTRRQNYGYAMSLLIHNLVQRNGNDPVLLHSVYAKIKEGKSGITALTEALPDKPSNWVPRFFEGIVREDILPNVLSIPILEADIMTPARSRKLVSEYSRGQTFPHSNTPGLGATLSMMRVESTFPSPASQDRIGFLLKGPALTNFNLSAIVVRRVNNTWAYDHLGNGLYIPDDEVPGEGVLRLDLPDAARYMTSGARIIPVVSNSDLNSPDDTGPDSVLYFGVYQDYVNRSIQSHSTQFNGVWYDGEYLDWPVFAGSGRFTARDVTLLSESYPTSTDTNVIPSIRMHIWGEPDPVELTFSCTPTSSYFSGYVGTTPINLAYAGELEYQVSKVVYAVSGTSIVGELVETGPWTSSNSFTLRSEPNEAIASFSIRFRYKYFVNLEPEPRTRNGASGFHAYVIRQ